MPAWFPLAAMPSCVVGRARPSDVALVVAAVRDASRNRYRVVIAAARTEHDLAAVVVGHDDLSAGCRAPRPARLIASSSTTACRKRRTQDALPPPGGIARVPPQRRGRVPRASAVLRRAPRRCAVPRTPCEAGTQCCRAGTCADFRRAAGAASVYGAP